MGEHSAVIGIGQTKYDAKRIDVSMPGLIREAALAALADADLGFRDRSQVRPKIPGNTFDFQLIM